MFCGNSSGDAKELGSKISTPNFSVNKMQNRLQNYFLNKDDKQTIENVFAYGNKKNKEEDKNNMYQSEKQSSEQVFSVRQRYLKYS